MVVNILGAISNWEIYPLIKLLSDTKKSEISYKMLKANLVTYNAESFGFKAFFNFQQNNTHIQWSSYTR